eukprot:4297896-Pleurochrysis_carterae.AAC.1
MTVRVRVRMPFCTACVLARVRSQDPNSASRVELATVLVRLAAPIEKAAAIEVRRSGRARAHAHARTHACNHARARSHARTPLCSSP